MSAFAPPEKCPQCRCNLAIEAWSIDRQRVKLLCASCLRTLAIAVKSEARSGDREEVA
ncbi:hypothetical protein H6G96_37460 [Nostoc sp. FACHB-892]|uniref:hypothetical protein n=1 Tax=Nostoc sp. FACHB-892 TaxID=2692843 RepID=UPI0016823038|nr:hypothetical protein [Nostoc sp. FACHB-892]MBD2731813.1 hypothetical protein [Nostoc sp. FACHB-892]